MQPIRLLSAKRSSKYLLFFGALHVLLLPLAFFKRGTLELPFNLFVAPELFPVFNIITFMGDGWFALAIFGLAWIVATQKKLHVKAELINFLIVSVLMGIGIYVFKQLIFPDVTRPIAHFTTLPQGWNPDDFALSFHRFRSFPSGHTASAATYGFFLMRYVQLPYKRLMLYAAILLVGYSRVFLFQHFVADVFAGVLLGLACVWVGDWISHRIFKKTD